MFFFAVLAAILTFILVSNTFKYDLKINLNTSKQGIYTLELQRYNKCKKKYLYTQNKTLKSKIGANVRTFELKDLPNDKISSIEIYNKTIRNLDEIPKTIDNVKKELNLIFFLGSLLIGLLTFLIKKYFTALKAILYRIVNVSYRYVNKRLLIGAAVLYLIFSFYVLMRWLNIPLCDIHDFRQTQTAITAFYLLKDFNLLNYQTPVLGYPWSIPLEFPAYQLLCAWLVKLTHMPLDASGRIVSWVFMVLTLYPVYKIIKQFNVKTELFYIFSILYLASPIYLFWGRTFMIETMAVFLSTTALYYVIKFLKTNKNLDVFWVFLFAALAGLVKITTLLPFVFAGFVYYLYFIKRSGFDKVIFFKLFVSGFFALVINLAWIHHSDTLKMANPLAHFITSKGLNHWNYGTLAQRFSLDLYNVLFFRAMNDILGNIKVFAIMIVSLLFIKKNYQIVIVVLLITYLVPYLVFANLHIVHNYYQTANAVFLIMALAIFLFAVYEKEKITFMILLIFTLVSMFFSYDMFYKSFSAAPTSDSYKIGLMLRKNLPSDSAIIYLGYGWNSALPYYSQRKAVSLVHSMKRNELQPILDNPCKYTGGLPVSAMVTAENGPRMTPELSRFKNNYLKKNPDYKMWRYQEIYDFKVYFYDKSSCKEEK